jgi:predicted GIY-YIG superfamily endonuclease
MPKANHPQHERKPAFQRERQVKGGSRKKKIDLIASTNPRCEDLLPKLSESGVEER